MSKVWLGIDTSNYTTSVAAVTEDGALYNIKIPLTVKPNEKGLRQSDAVFLHTRNLPSAMEMLCEAMKKDSLIGSDFSAVGVSTRPRSLDGSYMPCFLSGISVAKSVSVALNIPLYEFSHQDGHISAALYGSGTVPPEVFYSFHLSGGTCELLEVRKNDVGFIENVISDSADITLGQLVDRSGVAMGISFPCGPELEKLAARSGKQYKIKIKGDNRINLAGFENKVNKMLSDGESHENVASYVYYVITEAIRVMLEHRANKDLPVLFAGGVSGSSLIRKTVSEYCDAKFSPAEFTSDNAVGIALLTKEKYLKGLK